MRALTREVFGPVLHVVRYREGELAALIDALNATGLRPDARHPHPHRRNDRPHLRAHPRRQRLREPQHRRRGRRRAAVRRRRPVRHRPQGRRSALPAGASCASVRRSHRSRCAKPRRWPARPANRTRCRCIRAAASHASRPTRPNCARRRASPSGSAIPRCSAPVAIAQRVCAAVGARCVIADDPLAPLPDAVLFAGSDDDAVALRTALAARDGPLVPVIVARDGGYDRAAARHRAHAHHQHDGFGRQRVAAVAGGTGTRMKKLDAIDVAILDALQRDGRCPT